MADNIDGVKWESIRAWAEYEMFYAKRARDEGKNKDIRLQGKAVCNTLSALIDNMEQRDKKWGGTPSSKPSVAASLAVSEEEEGR